MIQVPSLFQTSLTLRHAKWDAVLAESTQGKAEPKPSMGHWTRLATVHHILLSRSRVKHKLPGLMACVRVDWAEGTQPLCLVFYANSKGKSLTSKVSNQILSKLCCSQWPNTITNSTDCVMFRASSQDNFRGLCGLMQTKLHAWQTNAQGVFFLNKAACRTLLET